MSVQLRRPPPLVPPPHDVRNDADQPRHDEERPSDLEAHVVVARPLLHQPSQGRPHDGGCAPEHDQEPEGRSELLQTEDVNEDNGGESDKGSNTKTKYEAEDYELSEAAQKGENYDADAGQEERDVGDGERVDAGEVRDVATTDPSNRVGDANDRD